MIRITKFAILLNIVAILLLCVGVVDAAPRAKLLDVDVRSDMGNQVKLVLKFSNPPTIPENFSMEEPPKMVFDFFGVENALSTTKSSQRPALGVIKELNVVDTDEQTRLVLDVGSIVAFNAEIDGNVMTITLADDTQMPLPHETVRMGHAKTTTTTTTVSTAKNTHSAPAKKHFKHPKSKKHMFTPQAAVNDGLGEYINELAVNQRSGKRSIGSLGKSGHTLQAVDFSRGDNGEGRLEVNLATVDVAVDFKEDKDYIVAEFKNATIAEQFQRRFDVKDFGTPIQMFAVMQEKNKVIIKIKAVGEFDKIAYQLDNKYVVEIRPVSQVEKEISKSRTVKFVGERISLNFQDIEVRAVLQLMADFTGLNIVASDSVGGHVTLRLENVPWDQALDFILKSKGLGERESGNVILIAPNEEIASREQLELDTREQAESLAPLRAEFIQINYAKAADIMAMLVEDKNSMLSKRGVVTTDDRTNTLLIKDTEDKLADIKELLVKLDVPVRQVLIEAQVVQTSDNFEEALGIKFGGAFSKKLGQPFVGISNNITNSRAIADAGAITTANSGVFFNNVNTTAATSGTVGISLARLPGGTLLDLELSALEYENKSKVLAKPKLITLDQQTASIESGSELAYSVTAQTGATPTTTFKKAVLKLEVTPQITPNDKVLMELNVSQDRPAAVFNGQASISTTNLQTNILVDNGETIVLGGIYTIDQTKTHQKVPFVGDIPIIGKLFNAQKLTDSRAEVLIFVTPKIIKS